MAFSQGIKSHGGSTQVTSAGKSFINTVIARIPFSYAIIDNITQLNPKYQLFNDLPATRQDRVERQSVFKGQSNEETMSNVGNIMVNKNYQQFMYANIELDKVKRIQDYRRMSAYDELSNCIDEICDELLVENDKDKLIEFDFEGENFSTIIVDEIKKEFDKFISIFEFEDNGWSYFRNFVVDGELFFENLISETHPEYGIVGIVRIPTELINPIYKNVENDVIEGFVLRKPVINNVKQTIEKEELIVLQENQVVYINSNIWNDDRSLRLSFLENARRAYKQLSLTEDSVVIQRLVRSPERLVFNVDVGNLNAPKAESYIKKLMQQYWSKKTYDSTTGRATNVFDPQSYLDSYWFPKRAGSQGTSVTALPSSSNFSSLDDLYFFVKKLYKSLKIPTNRLEPSDTYNDGGDMTRDELRFARFLMRIQKQFAKGIRKAFIVHLKLRKMWDEYKLRERYIKINFNAPTLFYILKKQQIFDLKYSCFNNLTQNEGISNSFAQKHFLDFTDEQMAENRERRRLDAALQFEIENILQAGLNWKEQQKAVEGATSEIAGGGGASGGVGEGSGSTPPDFGPTPEAGAEKTPPATGPTPAETEGATAGGTQTPPTTGGEPTTA